jgi:hypothetical protein
MAEALARTSLIGELAEILNAYRPSTIVETLDRQTLWAFLMHANTAKLESFVTVARANMPLFVDGCSYQLRAVKECKSFLLTPSSITNICPRDPANAIDTKPYTLCCSICP